MTYVETCTCGAKLEISGWMIRDIGDPVLSFRKIHAGCLERHQSVNRIRAATRRPT